MRRFFEEERAIQIDCEMPYGDWQVKNRPTGWATQHYPTRLMLRYSIHGSGEGVIDRGRDDQTRLEARDTFKLLSMGKPSLWKRLLRIEPGVALGQWLYDRIANNWHWLAAISGGSVMTYLSSITDWLSIAGPVSWGAIGIGSALLIAIIISASRYISAYSRLRIALEAATEKWSREVDKINPLDSEFQRKRINISDIAHPVTNVVANKKFIDCEIIGPGTILLFGGSFSNMSFMRTNLMVLFPRTPTIENITIFDNCEMYGGMITHCNVFILPNTLQMFRDVGPGFLTLTGDPSIDAPMLEAFANEEPLNTSHE